MRRNFLLSVLLLIAITYIPMPCHAQDTFPRDDNEAIALRVYNWYRADQAKLANLETDLIKVRGFISEVAPASTMVGTAIEQDDVTRRNELIEEIARLQERIRRREVAWERNRTVPPASALSFAGRYGPLSSCGKPSTDPRYDQIEGAIRNFPFNATTPPTTPLPANSTELDVSGLWAASADATANFTQRGNTLQIRGDYRVSGVNCRWHGEGTIQGNRFHATCVFDNIYPGGNAHESSGVWDVTVSPDGQTMAIVWRNNGGQSGNATYRRARR